MRASEIIKKGIAEAQGQIQLGPQLFVSRQTTMEGIKPRAVAWTSTAQKTNQGFTSDWVEWCKDNMAQWVTDTGILYDVAPGARILLLRTDRDVIQVARRYGLEIKNSFDLFEKMDWDVLRKDYDAIHHIPQGRDFFMSTWDVESTAWFDQKFLINPRKVKIDTGKTQNIEALGKLDELFQGQKNWKWTFHDSEEVQARFEVGGIRYHYSALEYDDNAWEIFFLTRDVKNTTIGITGTGNAAEVFSTVIDITRNFLQQYPNVNEIRFHADKPNRQKLYIRMAQRLLPKWNIKQVNEYFYLTRNN